MRSGGKWLASLLAISLLLGQSAALAQDSPDDLARRHFESGVAYLQESDYENALKAFQKAYELSKRPEILINIATVHERRNDLKSAVAALKQYLDVAPQGEERPTVEARIQNLQKRIDAQPAAQPDAGPPEVQDAGTTVAPAPTTTGTTQPQPAPAPQTRSNIPAFVLLGIGGVTAAGAVLTGVLAKGEYDDKKAGCGADPNPHCTADDVSSGKTLALTSTILTGVAVVSASVGAVLYFTNKPSQEKAAKHPTSRWAVGFAPTRGGAAASASFDF